MLPKKNVQACFAMLDIDVTKTEDVFHRLNLEGSCQLDMEESIHGCTHIQGVATHADVECRAHLIKRLTTKMMNEVNTLKEDVHHEVSRLDRMQDQILSVLFMQRAWEARVALWLTR